MDTEPALIRRALYDSMTDKVTNQSKLCLIMILNEYDYKESFVVDKEINMVAMFTQMINSVADGDLEFV
jgi:aminopeptidase-like protein